MATKAINKDGTPRKAGSGRKEGSTSFSNVPLSQLSQLFANPAIQIPVSRIWLESIVGKVTTPAPQPTVIQVPVNNQNSGITIGEMSPPVVTPVAPVLAIRDFNAED